MENQEIVRALEETLRKLDNDRSALVATIALYKPSRVGPVTSKTAAAPEKRSRSAYGGVTKTVRKAVLSLDGEFTKDDVEAKLNEVSPAVAERINGSVPTYLWRFNKKEKIIKQTQASNGRDPAKYVKL